MLRAECIAWPSDSPLDAIAILAQPGRNEAIDPVPVKTIEQQALTSLHRLRSAYVAYRTARINSVRGILRE